MGLSSSSFRDSADSVIAVLQDQAQVFRKYRGDDGRTMKWLMRTVQILYTLSTSTVLGEGISLVVATRSTRPRYNSCGHFCPQKPFSLVSESSPPTGSVQTGFNICNPQVIKDIGASYDAILDLFEFSENFLRYLDIYTKIPPTSAMTEIVVKIQVELLATLAIAT
ncbi:hypothetical protein EDB86DRAFT_3105350 [Lactarius hatsudake]|nr:hypothetical protein EDB86DRAFT_3105350 [Lactarius hatsudake]